MQGCTAVDGPGVGVGTTRNEICRQLQCVLTRRPVQWRSAAAVPGMNVGAVINQVRRHFQGVSQRRVVQRRHPVAVSCVYAGAAVNQQLHHFPGICKSCRVQRRPAAGVPGLNVGAASDQHCRGLPRIIEGCRMQRRVASPSERREQFKPVQGLLQLVAQLLSVALKPDPDICSGIQQCCSQFGQVQCRCKVEVCPTVVVDLGGGWSASQNAAKGASVKAGQGWCGLNRHLWRRAYPPAPVCHRDIEHQHQNAQSEEP